MRNAITSFCLLFASLFGLVHPASAESPTASAIFSSIGGTTTMDKGGAIHSQTRSIYAFGGGMTSFQGKRISLLAADPPSYSAGCSGISWHFGGFSFISTDEIRQLVEAVAQASLGVVVDLAMQTLCPQCYAVMSKLRDISNQMRNAAADACKIAQNFGKLLKKEGVFSDTSQKTCAEVASGKGETDSFMNSLTSPACSGLSAVSAKMDTIGTDIMQFLEGKPTSDGKTPPKELLDDVGNYSYEALTALGYRDGFVKNMLMSYMGMAIVFPKTSADCTEAFSGIFGSSDSDATSEEAGDSADMNKARNRIYAAQAVAGNDTTNKSETTVAGATPTAQPTAADATVKTAQADPSGATTARPTCFAPPLLTGMDAMGGRLLCGFAVHADMLTFQNKFNVKIDDSGIGTLCGTSKIKPGDKPLMNRDAVDPYMYICDDSTAKCMKPRLERMSAAVQNVEAGDAGQYTGLAWLVLDALYSGVNAIQANQTLPPETLRILNGSGYPLYRLLNIAAVYPAMADQLLQAYGAIIAVQYATDTISKLVAPGTLPQIGLKAGKGGMDYQQLNQIRSDILNLTKETSKVTDQTLARLNEKRALVNTIIQVNKSLQADVISQGLAGNANLAVSIRKQMNVQPDP